MGTMIRPLLLILLLASTAQAQFAGWDLRWAGRVLSIEQAVERITESDQREWLGYLASPALDGRRPNTAGYRAAVDFIEARCQAWGLQTERQTVPGWDQNLFAWIEGSTRPNEIVVIGAHLDHLGSGRLGADDNGSGSTALMGVAYAMSQMDAPDRTVVLQWYTAEESGLIGSKYYVANPRFPRGSPSIRSHVAMVNIDMVGRLRTNSGSINVAAPFVQAFTDLRSRYPFAGGIAIGVNSNNSDHAPFRQAGVPVAFLHTGLHNDYHTVRDTVSTINFPGLTQISRFATELVWRVANDPQTVQSQLVRDRRGVLFWHYSLAP
jgi:hypothetical protein